MPPRSLREQRGSRLDFVVGECMVHKREPVPCDDVVLALDCLQLIEKYRVLRLIADRMNVDVPDNALLVDDEDCSFCKTFSPENGELQSGQAVRPKIADQRIGDASQRFCPSLDGRNGVDANAQYLGIKPVELGKILLVRRHLQGSNRCECQGIESQDDVLLAAKLGQCDVFVQMRFQGEIRRFISHFRCTYISYCHYSPQ